MARIFITGSSDGLGLLTARRLIALGHAVTLHARSAARAKETLSAAPGAADCLVADLSSLKQCKVLATEANRTGRFDAVLHNAGVGFRESFELVDGGEEGICHVFAINVLAPYVLTCLMHKPDTLVYMTSGLHASGKVDASVRDITWAERGPKNWDGLQAYSDSKQMDTVLAFAIARRWPKVCSNAITPGWVATKMGGAGAPQDIDKSIECMVAALHADPKEVRSGKLLVAQGDYKLHPAAKHVQVQEALLTELARISGVDFPA